MSEDIVQYLRFAAEETHNAISSVLGEDRTHVVEKSVMWRAADEISSLRTSLKEAEASRNEIIEDCAKVADAYAKEWWGHTEEEHAAEKIADRLRALKLSAAPKLQKNDCQAEHQNTILRAALRRADSYIDSTPLMPGNSYKEIKAVIRAALECSDGEGAQ